MKDLKEDGSLDIQKISQLPIDECLNEITHFTKEQIAEYFSNSINESNNHQKTIYGSLKEDLASGKWFDAFDVINVSSTNCNK